MSYSWLEQIDYDKAVGQFRNSLNGIFSPFDCYGMGAYIPEAIAQVVMLAELFGQRVRGKDVPITREHANRRKK